MHKFYNSAGNRHLRWAIWGHFEPKYKSATVRFIYILGRNWQNLAGHETGIKFKSSASALNHLATLLCLHSCVSLCGMEIEYEASRLESLIPFRRGSGFRTCASFAGVVPPMHVLGSFGFPAMNPKYQCLQIIARPQEHWPTNRT